MVRVSPADASSVTTGSVSGPLPSPRLSSSVTTAILVISTVAALIASKRLSIGFDRLSSTTDVAMVPMLNPAPALVPSALAGGMACITTL